MKSINQSIFYSFTAVFKKELLHLSRNPLVVTFSIFFPIIEMLLLGYLLDINVRQIKTVVYDLSNTQESRQILAAFENTNDFKIVKYASSDAEIYKSITAGEAQVAIKVPSDYSRKILDEETADLLVLVDGSQVTLAAEAINVSNLVALKESLRALNSNDNSLRQSQSASVASSLQARISVLYNPESRSRVFFLPGLLIFDMPSITILLVAISIAAEREKGTFEQLLMTPIHPIGMIFGKTLPYIMLSLVVVTISLLSAHFIYQVPLNGNPLLLLACALPYMLIGVCLGALVASTANTQMDAINLGILVRVIPTLYLSGYIFPIESMPASFQSITKFLPDRYMMEISRAVILRGASWQHLWQQEVVLIGMFLLIFPLTILVYRKVLNPV